MTSKHRDPEYRANARIVRQQVNAVHRRGESVPCWRCGRAIQPGQAFDVGHINANGGNGMRNLAPEHRHKSTACRGNRSAGGAIGQANRAARAQYRAAATRPAPPPPSGGLLPW